MQYIYIIWFSTATIFVIVGQNKQYLMRYFSTISVYSDRATWSEYVVKAIKKQFSHWKLKMFLSIHISSTWPQGQSLFLFCTRLPMRNKLWEIVLVKADVYNELIMQAYTGWYMIILRFFCLWNVFNSVFLKE